MILQVYFLNFFTSLKISNTAGIESGIKIEVKNPFKQTLDKPNSPANEVETISIATTKQIAPAIKRKRLWKIRL